MIPIELLADHVELDDIAFQLYTSVTTGKPKGVMLTHGAANHMRLCEHLEPAYAWQAGDNLVNGLPNFHLLHVGIMLQCLYNGVTIDIVRQFDPAAMLDAITDMQPTLRTLTPDDVADAARSPAAANTDFFVDQADAVRRLADFAGPDQARDRDDAGVIHASLRIHRVRGATMLLPPGEHDFDEGQEPQNCGCPLPLIELRIVDANGDDVSEGEWGELLIRQPSITKGYWQQPDLTAEVIQHGWYRSGDIARRDADGFYYIVDSAKDMIVSGGENIYSAEVESALSTHPAVASVAVIGVPDARWGECVKALVIARSGEVIVEAELIAYCRERLAAYNAPKSVEVMDSFPLVPSGKFSKKDLRAPYWKDHGRGIA